MYRTIIKRLFLALGLAILFRACILETFIVSGGSMIPAVIPGDVILTNKLYYGLRMPGSGSILMRFNDVQEGDVVLLANVGEPPITIVRRVVGLPGDKIRVERGLLSKQKNSDWIPILCEEQENVHEYCAESLMSKKFFVRRNLGHNALSEQETKREFSVGENEVFVLADDRRDGPDSRQFGNVSQENIVGKVTHIWIPSKEKQNNYSVDKILPVKIYERTYFTKVN